MKILYNIHSSIDFIGYCILYKDQTAIRGNLLLFECKKADHKEDSKLLFSHNKSYIYGTNDLFIITDLLSIAENTLNIVNPIFMAKKDGKTFLI